MKKPRRSNVHGSQKVKGVVGRSGRVVDQLLNCPVSIELCISSFVAVENARRPVLIRNFTINKLQGSELNVYMLSSFQLQKVASDGTSELFMDGPSGIRKGAWTREEDVLLTNCIQKYGEGRWHQVPQRSGLKRCRKSCRLRWLNYLRPDIKRGEFAADEVDLIVRLHKLLGNRWSLIAGRLPGRTSNDVKNYWNTHLSKNYSPRRKEADQEKSVVKVTVLKPRPRAFTNNSNLNLSSLGKYQDQDHVQPAYHTLISQPPPPPFSEDELSWLNCLLFSAEEEDQHKESSSTCMVGDGSAGKHFSFSISSSLEEVNNIPPVVVGGETLMFNIDQENNESDSWSHQYLSSFNMDLWDL